MNSALTARLDPDAHVARRVSRRRPQLDLGADRVARLDEVDEPRVDDGLNRVVHVMEIVIALRLLEHLPVLVLATPE
jgi:hypothetical protein